MTVIHWFRCDLRVHDNLALAAAAKHADGAVIPLFILDDVLLAAPRMSAARVVFLLETLHALDASLRACGSRLVVRHGDPATTLASMVQESGAEAVFFNRDYTPFAHARDQHVAALLHERSVAVHTFQDRVVWEPDTLRTQNNTTYTTYAPYRRQWHARTIAERATRLARVFPPHLAPLPTTINAHQIPTAAALGHHTTQRLMPGGEDAGRERLALFLRLDQPNGVAGYAAQRDVLAATTTAQLSPYLHFGCVATTTCVGAALDALDQAESAASTGIERWLGELTWHDFYIHILAMFPHVVQGAFKPAMDALEWDNHQEQFAAWCQGQTGYPIVDAAMRQLNSEGWIANRARLIVASFLVKDLLVDWRWGERYFLQRLVDGDIAANNGNWQWIASTGTDSQPFFRMFSPISQSTKADPHGDYIRRYVPEVAALPTPYLHAPWTAPARIRTQSGIRFGSDYPEPLVDHAIQRERTLAMYRRVVKQARDDTPDA